MPKEVRKTIWKSRYRSYKSDGDHNTFLERVAKSLYYGSLPKVPCLSLPLTELSSNLFSESHRGKTLKRLHFEDAAELSRNACVSPCSLVLALLYLERLKNSNPEYVLKMAPSELFLVTLMVSNKFLQDDGEEDEVFCNEWATSGGVTLQTLHQIEREFLDAIDWRLYIGEDSFESGLSWLEHQVAVQQAKLRGWFTYGDLTNIITSFENLNLIKSLFTVYLALSLSYVASVFTLVASSYIVSQGTTLINDCASLHNNMHHKELYNGISTNNSLDEDNAANLNSSLLLDRSVATLGILNSPQYLEQYKGNETRDFMITPSSYPCNKLSCAKYFDAFLTFWQTIAVGEYSKLASNLLSFYVTPRSNNLCTDWTFSLNDIYLDIKQPSTSWYNRESIVSHWHTNIPVV